MPKKKRRTDGRMEIKRKMPDGKVRHFLGQTAKECEDKSRCSDQEKIPHGCLKNQVSMRGFFVFGCVLQVLANACFCAVTILKNRKKFVVRNAKTPPEAVFNAATGGVLCLYGWGFTSP